MLFFNTSDLCDWAAVSGDDAATMVKAYQHNHTTSSIAAGIRQLAANIQGRQDACVDPQNALDKAWTVLLDLDTSSQV